MKMRKTKLYVLSSLSVFGISLLVGSTFATSWAVTDKADPFSITVSVDSSAVEQGYYLTFESDGYSPTAASAVKMTSDSGNKAIASNITILDGSKVKIYYFDGMTYEKDKTDLSYTFGTTHGFASISGSEVTFDTDRSGSVFSLYLNNNDELYIDDETFKSYSGYYITYADDNYAFRSENLMNDTPSSGNIAQESLSLAANKAFKIEHFEGIRGIISNPNLQAATYPHFTTSNAGDALITIKEAATYKLMVSAGDDKVYIANDALSAQSGYYLTYAPNYDYRTGVKLDAGTGTNLGELSIDIAANTTVKFINVDAVNDYVYDTQYVQGDASKSYLSTSGDSPVLTFNKADTYDIYLAADGKVYTAIGSYSTVYFKPSTDWTQVITNKKMIYFVNNQGWGTVNAYVFKEGGSGMTSWPGTAATDTGDTNEYSQKIYSVEIDIANYDSVIFNNGNGTQTVDINITGYQDSTQLYINGWDNGKGTVGSYTGYRAPRQGPTYYAWVWETGQSGRWVALDTSSSHSGYYEMTVHSYETNMIFACCVYTPTSTDGSELGTYRIPYSTNDLELTGTNNCYTISGTTGGAWSHLN